MNPRTRKSLIILATTAGIVGAVKYPGETTDSGRTALGVIGNGALVFCNVVVEGVIQTDVCPDAHFSLGSDASASSTGSNGGSSESANNNDGRVYITPGGVACGGVIDTVTASSGDGPISIASDYNSDENHPNVLPNPGSYQAVGGEVIYEGEEVVIC